MSGKNINFNELEELARKNQWSTVEKMIKSADRKYFLTKDLLEIATLARRAYRLSFANYLLTPLVLTPDHEIISNAPTDVLAEYAIVQTMLGGRKKAKELLDLLPNKTEKDHFAWVTYYFSFADYKMAIPHLEASIELEKDEYKKSIAQLNLSACLVNCQKYDEAQILIFPLRDFFKENQYTLLQANTEELLGQICIQQDNWEQAIHHLDKAKTLMTGNNSLYSLFIDKWRLICDMRSLKVSETQLTQFLDKAVKLKHSHTVRETLFYWAHFNNDTELIKKIYFGTPLWSYREFMQNITNYKFKESHYVWNGQFENSRPENTLEIKQSGTLDLKLSKQELKLITALSRDFFEPLSISALFYQVYPDEYFDHQYSTSKTYKLIQRLNKKLKTANVDIQIVNSSNRYHLNIGPDWGIKVPNPELRKKDTAVNFNLLEHFRNQSFSRQDVMDQFQMSRSTALRWIGKLQKEGKILKIGQGPGSFYKVS